MIVSLGLGQQRPSRDEELRRGDQNESHIITVDSIDTSESIARLIADSYESPMRHGRIASIRLANGKIRPDQRFYDREIEVAAQILAARSPTTETAQNWYVLIRQYMGYRIVTVAFCKYGEEADPVTRQCVTKKARTRQPQPEPEPKPKPLLDEKTTSLILPLGIVGVIALVMLGSRK